MSSPSPKRASPSPSSPPPPAKRARIVSPAPTSPPPPADPDPDPRPVSLHSWLHPSLPPLLQTHSPPLHAHTSTFQSIAISYTPPAASTHISTEAALAKEVRRVVRELDVPRLCGPQLMRDNEGAFQDGEGRRRVGGKERVREPDHRMWAARVVILKEGCDGTKGEGDYQLMEISNDDGEKYGGDRVLKVLKEHGGVDVIVVCCRWYGGDMLGPIRFQHIGTTTQTALSSLQKLVKLTDLRSALIELDTEIASLRASIASAAPASQPERDGTTTTPGKPIASPAYDTIDDIPKLERLVKARERSREMLASKAAWSGMQSAVADGGA